MLLMLLLLCVVASTFNIQRAETSPSTIVVPDDYPTIQDAINHADDGDTIFVRNGTYYEQVVVSKSVSLVGEDRNNTIIFGKGSEEPSVIFVTANDTTVSGFTIQNGSTGIYLYHSFRSSVLENNVSYNDLIGIFLSRCYSCNISNNIVSNNNLTNIMLCNTSYVVTCLNTAKDSLLGSGIGLLDSPNNLIDNNTFARNEAGGIVLIRSNNCTAINNRCEYNGEGIRLEETNSSLFAGNGVTMNNACGIYLCARPLYACNSNRIIDNNVSVNAVGVLLENACRNFFHHNNFINNTESVFTLYFYHNTWDDGYPSGGNYWSDYAGVDLLRGAYQNETGSDGIGDTPYVIDANNQDNYPLTERYAGEHKLVIVNVTTSKTGCLPVPTVCQGYNLTINIKVLNYGINTESINLTVFANTTVICDIRDFILTARNSTTVTFKWNTTGVPYGNYSIKAVISTVLGETEIVYNSLTDGWIINTIQGDVNGDLKVEGKDVAILAKAYNTKPGDLLWNPNADINGDDKVDGKDIAIVAKYYNTHYP
jgi:parallel beta-helix repeat protein